ncbi:MAG TPA: NADH-quinone oxidoreductase subunit M [Anaerolineae bacterium]|nr:NADH-quinone oxidoreductase subunit M [Anaerolineae bacterium]
MRHWWLLVLVGAPWAGGALVALLAGGRRRLAGGAALVTALASLVALLALCLDPGSRVDPVLRVPWIPAMGVQFALRLDALALPFLVNVLGVSLVAILYGWGYLLGHERTHLCYALILAFMGSMLGTLLADDALLFFVFWESMLVASSLLLAGWGEGERVGAVTLKYFIYTQAGSLLVLISIAWLVATTGSSDLGTIAARLSGIPRSQRTWVAALMMVGFCVKLAVFPLHTWLPDAHSIAPMPVTVMLAAAMLSMGAYGILRFPMMILGSAGLAALQLPVMLLALASEVYGALMCLACRDIKRIVAYSSVSQMGYVLFALASMTPRGIAGGIFHIINHGILKALLFMGVGLIMRATGRRRIDQLGGLSRSMPGIAAGISIGAIAITGVPPFCAFHSEWMIFAGGLSSSYPTLGYLELLAPLFTAAYAIWFATRLVLGPEPPGLQVRQNHPAMRWSFYLLVALAFAVFLLPGPIYGWANRATSLLGLGR